MLYLIRKEDYKIAVLDTFYDTNDEFISFKDLDEQLLCIGGNLLYNFVDNEHIKTKLEYLEMDLDDVIILTFEDVLELALQLLREGK